MKYRIIGSVVPAVEILFDESGESIYTQSGGMTWMSEHIEMNTNTRGGLLKGLGRVFTGESLFMVTFTSKSPNESISFAATAPGCIHLLDIGKNGSMIIAKGCFLCAQEAVNMKVAFTKKFSAGMFGGEGFVLQELSGSGIAFLEVAGDLFEKELAPGEVLKVDTGNVVAFEPSVKYEIETIKGMKNILFGGEGLFITKLTGPGKVIVQTQSFSELAMRIAPYVYVPSSSST